MKYLVLSDIHGGAQNVQQALSYFEKFKCDLIILLGDLLNHGPRNKVPSTYNPMDVAKVLNTYKDKIISIRGNCDSEVDSMVFDFPCNAAYGWIHIKNNQSKIQRIFLTHGHLHKIDTKEQLDKLGLNTNDIVLSGHTHVSGIFKKESGIVNINPGSTTIPKGGTKEGFAIIDESKIELFDLDGNKLSEFSFF